MSENTREIIASRPQQLYLHWRAVAEDFDIDRFPAKRNRLQSVIQEHFDVRDIPTRDISRVLNHAENNYIILEANDSLYYFDIYSEQFCGTNLAEANEFREQNPAPEVEMILNWVPVLQEVMNRNYEDGYFWSFLNNRDVVNFDAPEAFQNMTARELQMTLRGNIQIFEQNGGLMWIDATQRSSIIDLYRSYLEIIMWIGDRYEEGSDFFHKTDGEIDMYLRSIIYSYDSIPDCISYYVHIQREIYNNRSTSKKNKQAYQIVSQKLWVLIYERFQREMEQSEDNSEQETLIFQAIDFINIITERSDESGVDINNDLRNPRLAEEICIFILSREGWVLDTLENCTRYNLDFSDSVVWDRSPQDVIAQTNSRLEASGFSNPTLFLRSNFQIDNRLIVGTENTSYEDLSLEHKRQISLLARLIQKIDDGELNPEMLSEMDTDEAQQYIMELWEEITNEAFDAVREAYDRNFDADSHGGRPIYIPPDFVWILEDIGTSPIDIQTLRLFNDIRGHDVRWWDGFMNYSDENLNIAGSLARSAWIIIGTIAVVMLATALTWGVAIPALAKVGIWQALIAAWWGLSTAWSLTSIGIGASVGTITNLGVLDPRSHDSLWEAIWDVSSDLVINTFHAIYMERLTMQLWNQTWNLWRAGLIGWDLWSGIGIEVIREHMIDSMFQWAPLLWDIHTMSIEEAFWGLNYEELQEHISPELELRFSQACHIYHLWNGYDMAPVRQEEFRNIDWTNGAEIALAIENWVTRQEERI